MRRTAPPSASPAPRRDRDRPAGPDLPLAYARQHSKRFLAELKEFIRFPSVSADPGHATDLRACARWLASHLRSIGLSEVEILPGRRHPLVYAAWTGKPDRPTVLFYGHYDVQPPDPVGKWASPPFDPVVRGGDLYGRGASDDKGPLLCHIKAFESYLETTGELPVNVKCLLEGEEEIGSPGLGAFLDRNRQALAAEVAVMSDTRMPAPDQPAIVYSLRGSLALELEVRGPARDLHSGAFGGAVHNPIQALCEIVARLHDRAGRIAIPGFYDSVRRWGPSERAHLARTGPSDAQILRDAGAARGWGERGHTLYERTTLRPALTINGISGGYQGPGTKSIIPASARALLSFRLVPDQDPKVIEGLFRRHISSITPPTVTSTLRSHSAAPPALVDRRHPVMEAAVAACRKGFGAPPVFLRSGGTIPVVNAFRELLGIPTVLMGFALPDDRMHAPNERFHLPNFFNGLATCIRFLSEVPRASLR